MPRKITAGLAALLLSLAGLLFGAAPSLASPYPHDSSVLAAQQPGGGTFVPLAGAPGTYKPDASNTGYVGTLTGSIGTPGSPLVITADNTVIDSKNIYGDVKVQARNVTIKNSYLHCGSYVPSGNSGCVDANSPAVFGLKLFNNVIHPDTPSYYRDGVVGHEYYAARNHVWGTNDGFGVFNKPGGARAANTTIEANYVHDTVYFRNDPAHSDGTHNDGVQVRGGENIRIWANNIVNTGIVGPAGTDPSKPGAPGRHGHGCTIMLQNDTGVALKNVVVEQNWLDDGLASICIKPGTVTVQNNNFLRNQWPYQNVPGNQIYIIRIDSRSGTVVNGLSTNKWEDTGAALNEGRDAAGLPVHGIWYDG
ncbi:hypothetical protein [Pseudarthrobacter sp. H2]|uniref:hypothetical protein n=1 Tax=Pseudarthrobacter sp. H2 TaxID=3418415 RepID=UPI003CF2E333